MKYRLISELTAILESTNRQFLSQAKSDIRQESSKDYIGKFQDVTVSSSGVANIDFIISAKDGHSSHKNVIAIPNLINRFKRVPKYKTLIESYNQDDIKVYCDCADFKFRFAYWMNASDSYADIGDVSQNQAITNAPIKTNPNNDKGPFCKHLRVSVGILGFNMSNIYQVLKKDAFSAAITVDTTKQLPIKKNAIMEVLASNDIPKMIESNQGMSPDEKLEANTSFDTIIKDEHITPNVESDIQSENVVSETPPSAGPTESQPKVEPTVVSDSSAKVDNLIDTNGRIRLPELPKEF